MENKKWYAVLTDNDDTDWGDGSYDLDEAIVRCAVLRDAGHDGAYIAVIAEGDDPICVDEIRDF